MPPTTPVIGLPADSHEKDSLPAHSIGDKYVRAAIEAAGCMPLVIPALGDLLDIDVVLDRLDGLIITGATSNVHPDRYGTEPHADYEPYDEARDSTTFDFIRKSLDRGMPLFCICRGFQELNVLFGGTLETEIQTPDHRLDHRAPEHDDPDIRYGPVHPIHIRPGGILHDILEAEEVMVNTVHRQGIHELGNGLTIEATAPDDIVEAVSVDNARGFALGVQWHPEYKATTNPVSMKLFKAFGAAAAAYMKGGNKHVGESR